MTKRSAIMNIHRENNRAMGQQKKLKKLLTNETPHDNISELRVNRTTTKQTSKRMTDEP